MTHSFFVRVDLDPGPASPSRETIARRLEQALAPDGMVRTALLEATACAPSFQTFEHFPETAALRAAALKKYEGNEDTEADDFAPVSPTDKIGGGWVMVWDWFSAEELA